MSTPWIAFLIALGVVAFFMLAFALTIIFKGHYMDTEIGTNPAMRKRGIRCTAAQFRAEEQALRRGKSPDCAHPDDAACGDCTDCGPVAQTTTP